MSTAGDMIRNAQAREDWTDATLLSILTDYLEQSILGGAGLRAYLDSRAVPRPARPPGLFSSCECGNDSFWLIGVQLVAVCTECGRQTPLGVSAFTIRAPGRLDAAVADAMEATAGGDQL